VIFVALPLKAELFDLIGWLEVDAGEEE
jgi:hypothetical protein